MGATGDGGRDELKEAMSTTSADGKDSERMIPLQIARKLHESASKFVGEGTAHINSAFSLDDFDARSRQPAAKWKINLDSGRVKKRG